MNSRRDGDAPSQRAARAISERVGPLRAEVALILGSGLGAIAESLGDARSIPFGEIPGFAAPTVRGHAGRLVAGTLDGREVIAMQGRFHLYEGHPGSLAALPVRTLHALGVRTLVVSNAAGGIRRTFRAGDLMLIHDHLNLMWRNPLIGPVEPGESRFPDMSAPYDRRLLVVLREAALHARVPVVEGVYAGLLGPAYETPAEVRMLERMGADAVGMSTVPEVLAARALGMRVAGVSCISNPAAGLSTVPLSHAEVLETTARVASRFVALLRAFIARLDPPRDG
ncbi:MAG: purine-nucleoside phosphorylase [Gemmatimonadaceae bacterium]